MKKKLIFLFWVCVMFLQTPLLSEIYSRLEGVVRDKDNGKLLVNAEVLLYEFDHISKQNHIYKNKLTDVHGHFVLDGLRIIDKERLSYFISCRKIGYVPIISDYQVRYIQDISKFTTFLNLKQGENRFLEIVLEKGGSIRVGLFKKEQAGIAPFSCKDVTLSIMNLDKNIYVRDSISASFEKTGTDGFAYFNSLYPGEQYLVLVRIDGLPEINQHLNVSKGNETKFSYTYDLTDETGISGYITRNNLPFPGTSVYVGNEENKLVSMIKDCLTNGYYKFFNLPPGKYRISFINEDENQTRLRKDFSIIVQENISTILNVNFD